MSTTSSLTYVWVNNRRTSSSIGWADVREESYGFVSEIILPRPGGQAFTSDNVTVSAKKGNLVHVVADAWHLEQDCHHEWLINYSSQDMADMVTARAEIAGGVLVIIVSKKFAYCRPHA
ncbi:hypothetical protein EW146_g6918 [Bondarzewia mesenterica]|uniref:SHSP domain-containing protein n=1 Tax=Bondarzewia mesenterica TaxID=1095465 RepID=A0A4S4LMW6_9AGAM|nr:hypothetical protein EW146_g6918 [Bondarzewia mesenterica]